MSINDKLHIVQELLNIVEYNFIRRLKEKNPKINQKEINKALRIWYRSQAPSVGVASDISRFSNV